MQPTIKWFRIYIYLYLYLHISIAISIYHRGAGDENEESGKMLKIDN